MTAPPPRRPWWKRKRWAAAAVLWIVVAYPLCAGPALYCHARGWLSSDLYNAAFNTPLNYALRNPFGDAIGFTAYIAWWARLGLRHAATY